MGSPPPSSRQIGHLITYRAGDGLQLFGSTAATAGKGAERRVRVAQLDQDLGEMAQPGTLPQSPSPEAQPLGPSPPPPPPLWEVAKPTRKLELLKPGHHNHQRARLVARSFRWVGTSGQSPGRAPGFLPCEPDLGLELREGGGKDRSWAGSLASPSPLSFSALFLSILRVPPTSFVLLFHPLRMHIEDITLPPCAPVSHASSLSTPHLSPDPSGLGPTASALRDEIGEAH